MHRFIALKYGEVLLENYYLLFNVVALFFFFLQSLTEDVVSGVLQVIDEEQKRKGATQCSEPLAVQVAACIVSLCGWAAR